MMNAGNLKGKTRQMSDWRRRMIAFVSALTLLISSCGLTAFAEPDEDIYSDPVTAPIPAANTSPEPEEGEAEATPAPEGQPETGTEPQEATGEETETGEEPKVSEEPEDLTVYEPGTLTAEADGVGITVDYTAEARVPEGAALTLTRAAGGDLYSALKSASKVLKTEENATWKRELGEDAVFYAITLTDSEGNEVHPETGVTLTCTNLEIPADATGFVTGDNAENLDWKDTLTVGFLPDAIGYAYLKQVQIGTVTLTHEDRDYMVTAAYGPDAGFPAGTELKVREILPGTPEYALYSGMTDEALNEDWAEITLERYFDIAFVANGEELEPKADVDVQIVFRDKIEQNEETEVAAVHIENNEANVIEAETDSTKTAVHDDEAIDTVTFTSDSFSVYGVVQKKKITKKVLAADGKTYEIEVSYGPEANIPEESQVKVEEIPEGSDLWEAYRKQTAAALNADDVRMPGLYDISIIDAEGGKVTPDAPVNVAFKLITDENITQDLQVVHFKEEIPQELVEAEVKPEEQIEGQTEEQTEEQTPVQSEPLAEEDKIASETITASVEGDIVTFDTQSFSVYAFAYTVDFYYGEYEYHLEGGTFMSLKDLLVILHIVDADHVQEFVNNITDVTFSDPTLLSVSKVDEDTTVGEEIDKLGLEPDYSFTLSPEDIEKIKETKIVAVDWALISLIPFSTEEKLVIQLNNGTIHEIRITDDAWNYEVMVNDKNGGWLGRKGQFNFDEFGEILGRDQWGNVQYIRHTQGKRDGSIEAIPYNHMDFAFWLLIGSDGSWTQFNNKILTTDQLGGKVKIIAFFVPKEAKVIVRGNPESPAWLFTPRDKVRYVYYGIGEQHDDVPRYNYTTDESGTIEWQSSFDAEEDRNKYNFLGWYNSDQFISKGHDIVDKYIKHNIKLSDITENTILIPKYELKEEYRDYRIVWLDGSNGINPINDKTYYSRTDQWGRSYGAGNALVIVDKNTNYTLPDTCPGGDPLYKSEHHYYKVDRWYDTVHGVMYKPGDTVTITDDTVFYASWFPQDYDFSGNANQSQINTIDTSSFIHTSVYDYNNMYNMRKLTRDASSSYITSAGHYEEWHLNMSTDKFIFLTTKTHVGSTVYPVGMRGTNENDNHEPAADNTHYNGYSANIAEPADLFNTSIDGVKSVGSGNYLFTYNNQTGYYSYDSSKNAAAYGNNRFYVYSDTEKALGNYGTSDFLPFNNGKSGYSEDDGEVDYWFGMKSIIDFYLPNAPGEMIDGRYGNRSTKDKEMVYKFSGDDDVWVYVDDVLVLNMSGIHGQIYGEINFSKGTYTIAGNGVNKKDDPDTGMKVYADDGSGTVINGTLSELFAKYGKTLDAGDHHLKLVYLERGASQSNCAMYFNLAPRAQKLKIRKVTDLSNMDTSGNKYVAEGAEFKIYTEDNYRNINNGGQPINSDDIKQEIEMDDYHSGSTFISDQYGRFFEGELPIGVYYIVETKAPYGLQQLSAPIKMTVEKDKVIYGPDGSSTTRTINGNGTSYLDIYVNNDIDTGSIKVEKNWDASVNSLKNNSNAVLFTLERIPDLDIYGANIHDIYTNPTKYGLTDENIYQVDESTYYLKLNNNAGVWNQLTITGLPMACISATPIKTETNGKATYPVVPCYYKVTEIGILDANNEFQTIDPERLIVTYSGTNAILIDDEPTILARKNEIDTLTIKNESDLTNVDVLKLWDKDTPYAGSVSVKLFRSVETPPPGSTATIHMTVTLTDAYNKATAVDARVGSQSISLIQNDNVFTGDVTLAKGSTYDVTFTGRASEGYSISIENGQIVVGQDDNQTYATNGTVTAPLPEPVSRTISLTINWTGEGNWSYKDTNHNYIWAQWIHATDDDFVQNMESFHASHLTDSVSEVDENAYRIRLGDIDKEKWNVSINNSGNTYWSGTGSDRVYVDIPAGTNDLSYVLTITKKNTTVINADGTMTLNLIAKDMPALTDWQVQPFAAGNLHTSDNAYQYQLQDLKKDALRRTTTGIVVTNAQGINVGAYTFGYRVYNLGAVYVTSDSPNVSVSRTDSVSGTVTIVPSATEVNIYFSASNSSSSLRPLRYRAENGRSTEPAAKITTIALNPKEEPVGLVKNDEPDVSEMTLVDDTVILDETNSWYYKWEDLPAYDDNGNKYHYYVVEVVPADTAQIDYTREETAELTSVTITNTPTETPQYASFSVKKVVSGVVTNRDFFIKLKREKSGTAEWLNRTDASTWNWGEEASATEFSFKDGETLRFTGLDIGYTYTAVENTSTDKIEVSGYSYDLAASTTTASATIADAASANPDTVTITNKYNRIPDPGTLVIKKEVTSGSADPADTVFTFDVTFKNSDDSAYTGSVTVVDSTRTEATTVTADENGKVTVTVLGTGTATISNIPAGKQYTVTEVSIPDNWKYISQTASDGADGTIASNETETVTVTNEQLIPVYAKKVWKKGTETLEVWPAETTVTFVLQYNAVESGEPADWQPVEKDAKDNTINPVTVDSFDTIVVFNNLPKDQTYRVVETKINNTVLEEEDQIVATGENYGTEANPLTITNTIPTVDISGIKVWYTTEGYPLIANAVQLTLYTVTMEDEEEVLTPVASTEANPNPAIILRNEGWTNQASWMNLQKYTDAADKTSAAVQYAVKETGVYFGELTADGEVPDDAVFVTEATTPSLSDIYQTSYKSTVAEDGKVDITADTGTITVTNEPKTVSITIDKNWEPAFEDEGYTWTATLNLMSNQSEEPIGEPIIIGNETDLLPSVTIENLPKFVIDEDGLPQLITYTVEETAYTLKHNGNDVDDQYYAKVDMSEEEGTLRYTITNSKRTSRFIVKKKWLDVFDNDVKDLPAVSFRLLYYFNDNSNDLTNHTNWYDYNINGNNVFTLSSPSWEWECPVDLPAQIQGRDVTYFVEEIANKDPGYNNKPVVVIDTSKLTDYQKEHFIVVLDGYENDNNPQDKSETWEKPFDSGLSSNDGKPVSGTITIRNRMPGEYMQFDIKKKFMEYINGSLWTTTSFRDHQESLVLKVQLYRRIVKDTPITIRGFDIVEGMDQYEILQDFTPYGNYMLVGYNPNGEPVADSRGNPFRIRRGLEGDWHWTIGNKDDRTGLARYGVYNGTVVRYEYIVVEEDAFKNSDEEKLDDYTWTAVLPAAWDGIDFGGVQCQIIMFDLAVGQDQDRLMNTKSTNLTITKKWENVAGSNQKVLVKLYRTVNSDYSTDPNVREDYTNKLNTPVNHYTKGGKYQDSNPWNPSGKFITQGALDKNNIFTDRNDNEKYIVLTGDDSVTIENIQEAYSESTPYRYWVEEVGYLDDDGVPHYSTNPFSTTYGKGAETFEIGFTNPVNHEISPVIGLQKRGKNELKIYNKAQTGSLKITKAVLFNGTDTNDVRLNGTYEFHVESVRQIETGPEIRKTVIIRIEDGVPVSYTIDNSGDLDIPSDGFVEITDLPEGDYVITEENNTNTVLFSITGGKNNGDPESRAITATVTAGKEGTAVQPAGMVVFTNNLPETTAVIEGIKTVKNKKSTDDASGYTFTLSAKDSGVPMPESPGNTATSTADGSITFGTITYNVDQVMTAGTRSDKVYTAVYSYTVNEELPAGNTATDDDLRNGYKIIENIKYDLTPKTVTVTVTYNEETGVMATSVEPSKAGLEFENEVLGKITVTKTVKLNGTPTGSLGKSFWVALYENNSGLAGELVGKRIININNEGIGSVEFTDLPAGKYLAYELTDENGTPVTENSAVIGEFTYLDITTDNSNAEITADKLDGRASIENCAYTTSITVKKVTTDNNFLAGAAFKIVKVKDAQGTEYSTGEQGAWESEPKEITTEDGVDFEDLEVGYYKLIETQVPAGYLALTENIIFEVSKEEGKDTLTITDQSATNEMHKFEEDAGEYILTVSNEAGAELPATGGSGTLIYTITGIFLITLAGTLLVARKRKANR